MPTINLAFENCQIKAIIGVSDDEEVGKPATLTVKIAGAATLQRDIVLMFDGVNVLFADTPRTGKTHTITATVTSAFGSQSAKLPAQKLCASVGTNNFLLMPTRGLDFADEANNTASVRMFATGLRPRQPIGNNDDNALVESQVVASPNETGVKLVALSPDAVVNLRAQQPGLRIVPEVFYKPQRFMPMLQQGIQVLGTVMPATNVRLNVMDKTTGKPIADVYVVAFTDFKNGVGADGRTDANGQVVLKKLGGRAVEQLFIYPTQNYWSFWQKEVRLADGDEVKLQPIKLPFTDGKRFFYPDSDDTFGAGVRVGVIDSGVGPHPDLVIAGGSCTVPNDTPTDFADVEQHGTHVAGLIAARGSAPTGMRGVAPGAELFAYRVFWKGAEAASNFAIVKAIEQAVKDRCDLINMSLGGGDADDALEKAIIHAYQNGTVVLVATGNDGRQKVSFPASFSLALAVSALGRRGTFPSNTTDRPNISSPFGTDPKNFVAAFSNIGSEVDLVAPGVGVLSTVPGKGYAAMSGTSMACPIATGLSARLLATRPDLLAMPRDSNRTEAIIRFICSQAKTFGFGPIFEGLGGIFP